MLIRTLADLKANVPTGNTVGFIGFMPKMEGRLHEGHQHIIQYAKTQCDVVCCTFFDKTPWGSLFGMTVPSWDGSESYCVSTVEGYGADLVWVPQSGIVDEVQPATGWALTIAQADAAVASYTFLPENAYFIQKWGALFAILSLDWGLSIKRFDSYKDGMLNYYRKSIYESLSNFPYILISPLLRADGLPHSSRFVIRPPYELERLAALVDSSKNISRPMLWSNPAQAQAWVVNYINAQRTGGETWECTGCTVYTGGVLPADTAIVEAKINWSYGSTYTFSIQLTR